MFCNKQYITVDNSSILLYTVCRRKTYILRRGGGEYKKMKIIVDHTSMQPIYEQIVEQIKKQILQGTLREGAPLDSVRMLAKDLKVSALTVKKAYDALEEEQLIATVHGKGSFVLGVNPSLLAEEQKREIEQRMEQLVAKARAYGMSDEELRAVLELFLEA